MTQKLTGDTITIGRTKVFISLVMREGEIKRGVLVSRMRISDQTFAREYMTYLEAHPQVKYYPKERMFTSAFQDLQGSYSEEYKRQQQTQCSIHKHLPPRCRTAPNRPAHCPDLLWLHSVQCNAAD